MDITTEIRKVTTNSMFSLAQILEETRVSEKSWKILMASIKNQNDTNRAKYSLTQINLIEEYANKGGKLGAEILFDEWGTSGRSLPTLGLLWDLLIDAELYRAADYVAVNILGQPTRRKPAPSPPPVNFPPAEENCSISNNPIPVPYEDIEYACKWHTTSEIGRGAFGRVFKMELKQWSTPVAVKQLQNDNMSVVNMERQFSTEVNALSMYRHENLVKLLGYSSKESSYCLVYELLNNGSLEERLACEEKSYWHTHPNGPLHWKVRLNIIKDVAKALVYLHTSEVPLIHRDVKSANILLSHNFTAKLGDFGLVRLTGEKKPNSDTTSVIIGTSAYMAPETHYNEVTELVDTFSFGVVLFEVLSSLPPTDENRACSDLIYHMLGECKNELISPPLLDIKAGDWGGISYPCAQNLFKIAVHCVKIKDERPTMQTVLNNLNAYCP